MPSFSPKTVMLKTPLGRTEMTQRAMGLSMVERRLLILTDGTRTLAQLGDMMNSPVGDMVQHLQDLGLLVTSGSAAPNTASAPLQMTRPAGISPMGISPKGVTVPAALAAPAASRQANAPVLAAPVVQLPSGLVRTPRPAPTPAPVAAAFSAPRGGASAVPQNAFAETASPDLLPINADSIENAEYETSGEATEDELASDFSEELTIDGMSDFERESSRFHNSGASQYPADPSSTLQRAITTRGIALGKAYLINISSRLLDSRDAHLLRSITQIKTEGELYHQFELVIDTIGTRLGSGAINEILEKFDEQINQA